MKTSDFDEREEYDRYEELEALWQREIKDSLRFEASLWRAELTGADALYIEENDKDFFDAWENELENAKDDDNIDQIDAGTLIFFDLLRLRNRLLAYRRVEMARLVHAEMLKYLFIVDGRVNPQFRHLHITIVEFFNKVRTGGVE
jgi:hypothetical protein